MTGTIGRALTVLALLAATTSPAAAQRLIRAEASVGGLTTGIAPGGWPLWPYVDGAWAVLPMTSAVGELEFGGEVAALGGVRQDFFRSRKGNVYGQLLMGVATGYSSRCDLCQPKAIEFGLGGNIA